MKGRTALLLAIAIAPYFVRLGVPDLWDVNETLYAEPPREALETGEWLVPTMNYQPWFVKPPGVTWVTMPFYAVLGSSELAGRLPMALAAALTILLTWHIGRRTAGEGAGLLGALVLATMGKHFMFSRQLAGDVFLTLGFTAAIAGWLDWFQSEGRRRGGLWVAAAVLGLATLMKGPIALLLPALFAPLHLAAARQSARWRQLRPWAPVALALLLGVPWFVYAWWRCGAAFTDTYFGRHHFERFFTDELGSRGPWYYPLVFLLDIMPWGAALPGALWAAARAGLLRREPWRTAWVWSALLLVFFSLSSSKREVYLLPVYPFTALLIGATVAALAREASGWRLLRFVIVPLPVVAVLMIAGGAWVAAMLPLLWMKATGTAVLGALWLAFLLPRVWRRDAGGAVLTTAVAMVCTAVWVAVNLDVLQAERPSREFAQYITAHAEPGADAGRYGVGLHSLSFYGRRPFFVARTPAEVRQQCRAAAQTWIVMPEERLADVGCDPGLEAEVALRRTYVQVSAGGLLGGQPLERALLLVRVRPRHD